ncbi:secreted protein/lipoprotein [Streptomyces sp. NBC_01465]|uniref:secreted protein/lipoprotein n=1 Tax=Streptomyces sp. NBC_01465 TaxID=2903878 RepID=UPI002E2FE068|nr:secreted protein/lipoprotein [Streptomyces sp. NBC_01465]
MYKQFWQEMEVLYADSTGKKANLKKYAASNALLQANVDAKSAHDRHLINVGHVVVDNPTATQANLNRQVPNVVISSCLDISQWKAINATTKKPASLPSTRLTKYVIVATVEHFPEGWKVTRNDPKGQAC